MFRDFQVFFFVGFIAMYATLASRDVDCCLIPESPFFLESKGGLFEFIGKRLKENGHMVIVIAEGAGQDLLSESNEQSTTLKDASGNKLLQDVGLWISQRIKVNFIEFLTEEKTKKLICFASSSAGSFCQEDDPKPQIHRYYIISYGFAIVCLCEK